MRLLMADINWDGSVFQSIHVILHPLTAWKVLFDTSVYWIRLLTKKISLTQCTCNHRSRTTLVCSSKTAKRTLNSEEEGRTFTLQYLNCFCCCFFFLVPFFVQQNRSSEGLTCMAGVLLIIFIIFLIHVFTLVVCPLCRVGPCLHWTVGVHQNGLKRQSF